jgi:hypothetical protein
MGVGPAEDSHLRIAEVAACIRALLSIVNGYTDVPCNHVLDVKPVTGFVRLSSVCLTNDELHGSQLWADGCVPPVCQILLPECTVLGLLSVSRDSNDSQTSGSPVRRWCATSLPAMAPSLIQGFLARQPAGPRSRIHSACERACCTISTSTFRVSAGLFTSLKNAMRAPRMPSEVRNRT